MPVFMLYIAAAVFIVIVALAIIQYRKSRNEDFDKRNY